MENACRVGEGSNSNPIPPLGFSGLSELSGKMQNFQCHNHKILEKYLFIKPVLKRQTFTVILIIDLVTTSKLV